MQNPSKIKHFKTKMGQFFTKKHSWLHKHIVDFIINSDKPILYDPFAGNGDLFDALSFLNKEIVGLDIDPTLGWQINDSLKEIPKIKDAIIITNPPYVAKNSATRKQLGLDKYFENSIYEDTYLIALEKMLEASDYVVAIVPESFIHSNFKQFNKLVSITIIEDNPFLDTENPVCVVCFDNKEKEYSQIKIYKNNKYINNLKKIFSFNLEFKKTQIIKFNSLNTWLALKCIDGTIPGSEIRFDLKENFDYDWQKNLKYSSRHFTLIELKNIDFTIEMKHKFIQECNNLVNLIRKQSDDILLSPFKGNNKEGKRRRRITFALARAIIERVYEEQFKK